ncbi:MAG: hypothetical protein ACFE75_13050, partial [Candidatus Hodarchaeota archaeon]
LFLKKAKQSKGNDVNIKIFSNMNELIENNITKTIKFHQNLIYKFPSKVIPISGNIELIKYLFTNFKTFAETFEDLKIIYRPFGFLNYSKHFDNISDERQTDKDLLLIGTGNIEKYHVKFNKRIKIAGKDIKISYFKYNPNFGKIWSDLSSEKLIFREIAKDLTCCYDPGVFINITGLYFIKNTSFNTNRLFALLTILNSKFLDSVFKTLFSTLHMAGGFLRFNGSFIKRLPMPSNFPVVLSQLGQILQLLYQLKYDFNSIKPEIIKNLELKQVKDIYSNDIIKNINFFNRLSNSLVKLLYLDDFYLNSNLNYDILREFLDFEIKTLNLQVKFLNPQYTLKNYELYQKNEIDVILTNINNLYNRLSNNSALLGQIDHITRNPFPLSVILI